MRKCAYPEICGVTNHRAGTTCLGEERGKARKNMSSALTPSVAPPAPTPEDINDVLDNYDLSDEQIEKINTFSDGVNDHSISASQIAKDIGYLHDDGASVKYAREQLAKNPEYLQEKCDEVLQGMNDTTLKWADGNSIFRSALTSGFEEAQDQRIEAGQSDDVIFRDGQRMMKEGSPGFDNYEFYNIEIHLPDGVPDDEDTKDQIASAVAYAASISHRGENLGCAVQGRIINLAHDSTKARTSSFHGDDFRENLATIITEGSPVRKTDRAGEGTKGTRAIQGLGDGFGNAFELGQSPIYYG